jgi:hypothetical protein
MPRSLLWPDPRVKPPFGAAEIDWGHPLTLGLLTAFLFNEGAGRPQNLLLEPSSGAAATIWTPSRHGLALDFEPMTSPLQVSSSRLDNLGALSVVFRWLWNGGLGDDTWTYPGAKPVDGAQWWLVYDTSLSRLEWRRTYTTLFQRAFVTTISANRWYHTVGTDTGIAGSGNCLVYLDGVRSGTEESFASGAPAADAGAVAIGGANASAYRNWRGLLDVFLYYNRALSPSEALWLASEPYAMLRPIVRRRYFVPAVATPPARGRRMVTWSSAV